MSPGQMSGSGCSGKVTPLSSSGGVITYRRRKRDGLGSGGHRQGESKVSETGQENLRIPCGTLRRKGASELVGLSRIENNWRNVLQSILLSDVFSDDSDSQRCIQRALICGPFGISGKSNMNSVLTEESSKDHQNIQSHVRYANRVTRSSTKASKDNIGGKLGSRSNNGHRCLDASSTMCQNILFDVLTSEKFALLCDLLSENFQSNKNTGIFDFSLMISNMKKGDCEQSPGVFDLQIQLIWEKFRKIGQDMVLLSDSLSTISRASYQKQVGRGLGCDLVIAEQKYESSETLDTRHLGCSGHVPNQQSTMESFKQMNHLDSYTTTVFTANDSDPSSKPEQTDLTCLYKISVCKECGAEADGKKSLICDGCEAMYHVSCAKPAIEEIPRRSWYCAVCSLHKNESEVVDITSDQNDCLHQICVVCDRINSSEIKGHRGKLSEKTAVLGSSRECSPLMSRMEHEESPEPLRTATLRLCKQCGTCEDEDKRFLICSNKHCLYKYYHIRCLKSTQLASQHQPPDCWYCPSCLCRACLTDKDDDLICLCDACDEGYHVYCMKPPRSSVPKGMWYCLGCNMERAKKGMRIYEQWVLQKHGEKDKKLAKRLRDEKLTTEVTAVSAKKRNR